jgi:hypothetical protein
MVIAALIILACYYQVPFAHELKSIILLTVIIDAKQRPG